MENFIFCAVYFVDCCLEVSCWYYWYTRKPLALESGNQWKMGSSLLIHICFTKDLTDKFYRNNHMNYCLTMLSSHHYFTAFYQMYFYGTIWHSPARVGMGDII